MCDCTYGENTGVTVPIETKYKCSCTHRKRLQKWLYPWRKRCPWPSAGAGPQHWDCWWMSGLSPPGPPSPGTDQACNCKQQSTLLQTVTTTTTQMPVLLTKNKQQRQNEKKKKANHSDMCVSVFSFRNNLLSHWQICQLHLLNLCSWQIC